jgi:hypothetical protein
MLGNRSQPFNLTNPFGMIVDSDGSVTPIGPATYIARNTDGLLVTPQPYREHLARNLGAPTSSSDQDGQYLDTYSEYAAQLTPRLIEAVRSDPQAEIRKLAGALTFLENWDYRFDPSSIGASIFDQWMGVLHGVMADARDMPPEAQVARTALERAVDTLLEKHGSDLTAWRWEHTQPARRYYPVWSGSRDDALGDSRLPASQRYQPLELPLAGHPTSKAYAASHMQSDRAAPAVWMAELKPGDLGGTTVWKRQSNAVGFLGRFRVSTGTSPLSMPVAFEGVGRNVVLLPQSE